MRSVNRMLEDVVFAVNLTGTAREPRSPGSVADRGVEQMETKADLAAWCPSDTDWPPKTRFMAVMLKGACLLVVLMLSTACANVMEVGKDARVGAPVPPDTRSVVIYSTAMKPDAIKNVDLIGAPQLFGRLLQDALKARRPSWDIRPIEVSDPVPDLSIAVTTELVNIDGGSSGLRFWIGLGGVGGATSTARVSVLDKRGKELAGATISESSECPFGGCVESNETAVQRNLSSLAADVAAFVLDPATFVKKGLMTSPR